MRDEFSEGMADSHVYSFDVFDTCVTRRYFYASDLLLDLAHKVLSQQNQSFDDAYAVSLFQERLSAEIRARQSATSEDINLDTIYQHFCTDHFPWIDLDKVKNMELELELDSVIAVPKTLGLYKKLRNSGAKIIFISDMYLPKDLLVDALKRCGYSPSDTSVYASGEVGLTKRSGNLYRYILEKEAIPADRLIHYGDNILSDIRSAKRIGLNVVHVKDICSVNSYEKSYLKQAGWLRNTEDFLQKKSKFYRRYYRSPFRELPVRRQLALSKLMAAARQQRLLSAETNSSCNYVGNYVAAPMLNVYVFWVLDHARKLGIDKLYFVSRNGQILYLIAKKICEHFNYPIECHYMYGSRAAWYPAAFDQYDDNFIQLILKKFSGRTIEEICLSLCFSEMDVRQVITQLSKHFPGIADANDASFVAEVLCFVKGTELKHIFERNFSRARSLVCDYLTGIGFFEAKNVGLVDVGWHLSAHNALFEVIKSFDQSGFSGFYIGVGRKHQQVDNRCPYYAFVSDEHDKRYSWLFKLGAMILLEDVFTAADHGTAIGYHRVGEKIEPILKDSIIGTEHDAVSDVQKHVLNYTDLMLTLTDCEDIPLARDDVIAVFERFYKYPTSNEVKSIASVLVCALTGHAEDQYRLLAHRLSASEFLYAVFSVILNNRSITPEWAWFQGSTTLSSLPIRYIGRLLSLLESLLLKLK